MAEETGRSRRDRLDEQTVAARVIGRAEDTDLDLSDVDILLVLEEVEQYLVAIGAVGGQAPLR